MQPAKVLLTDSAKPGISRESLCPEAGYVCADGITLGLAERSGVFRLAQYGPINSLSIRKNEVILAVQL